MNKNATEFWYLALLRFKGGNIIFNRNESDFLHESITGSADMQLSMKPKSEEYCVKWEKLEKNKLSESEFQNDANRPKYETFPFNASDESLAKVNAILVECVI